MTTELSTIHLHPSSGRRAAALHGLCGGDVHLPGEAGYDAARLPWNVAVDQRPAAVARPRPDPPALRERSGHRLTGPVTADLSIGTQVCTDRYQARWAARLPPWWSMRHLTPRRVPMNERTRNTEVNAATLHTWSSQVRLPGQAAAHPGPVDLTRAYLMHHALRRDLADFRAAVSATPLDEPVTWLSLRSRWQFFVTAVLRHQAAEDAGLRPALRPLTDALGRATLDEVETEHAVIEKLLAECTKGFDLLAPPPDVNAHAALVATLHRALELVGAHLDREERETLRILQEVLTQEEWSAIEDTHFTATLPPAEVVALVPWLLHRVPGPIRRDHLARAGRAQHLVWLATRAAFTRRHRLTFAHAG
jgi:hypothetical protein